MLTHLDLFSGIGGFAIAAQRCGFVTVGFCEREPYAQQVLKERFGAVLADAERERNDHQRRRETSSAPAAMQGQAQERERIRPDIGKRHCPRLHPDIFTLDGTQYAGIDLLTGGFPCQPFSVAGKRRGAADDRALWPEMLRVIDGAKPAWVLGENVAGIVSMELDNILSDLEALGYAAWPLVIPACAVDARHRRDRVWIVAHAAQREDHRRIGGGVDEAAGRRECLDPSADAGGKDVAHRIGAGLEGFSGNGAHRDQPGRIDAGPGGPTGTPCLWRDESDWFAESGMGRVAHGIPHRAHRLRGLGNAIVPQVAEELLRPIAELLRHTHSKNHDQKH